jgi:hypothetical protein
VVEKETYNKVWKFIKEKKHTYFREVIKLGTDQNRIDQNSLNEIITKLLDEKKIQYIKVGNMMMIEVIEK